MNLKGAIISIISVLLIAGVGIGVYCALPAIQGLITGNKYYTSDELKESYENGYKDGCKTETELTGQVKYYKEIVDDYYIQVNTLNDEIALITKNNNDYHNQIANLTSLRIENERTIATLQATVDTNNNTIASLEKQISDLQAINLDDVAEIAKLNRQIENLQALSTQLQTTNDLNLITISNLNNQIVALNNQIGELSLQVQGNNSQVNNLQNRINELENSVAYYEQYLANMEVGEQVVATFEYGGSVYNIQILTKNSIASVTTPTSTPNAIFNGWTVDGTLVDLATYPITTNTKFIADVTYKYNVNFVVDGETINTQTVTKNAIATLPVEPYKNGYAFDGWSLDTVNVIDVTTNEITANTTYTAIFTKLYSVTFMYESTTVNTQMVRTGEYATVPDVVNTEYKILNGWQVNNATVNVANYRISCDTVFKADITYRYDVRFMVGETVFNSQIVTQGTTAILPKNPIKAGYEFDGWSLNGITTINPTSIIIDSETTFYAIFTQIHTVTFIFGDSTLGTQDVRHNELATAPQLPTDIAMVFNGWLLNGNPINLTNYKITESVTLIADVTYYYNVYFTVDGEIISQQQIEKNNYPTAVANPTKYGYDFKGWTLDNHNLIDVTRYKVQSNLTFIAVFDRHVFTVTFYDKQYTDRLISTQNICYESTATAPTTPTRDARFRFDGWAVDDTIVDLSTYQITGDVTLWAKWTILTTDGTYNFMDWPCSHGGHMVSGTLVIKYGKVESITYEGYTYYAVDAEMDRRKGHMVLYVGEWSFYVDYTFLADRDTGTMSVGYYNSCIGRDSSVGCTYRSA